VAVFLPVFFFVVVPGRFVRRYEHHARVKGFIQGATAAATGAIAGAAIVIAQSVITGALAVIISIVALLLLLQGVRKVKEPVVVLLAAIVGLLLYS
jgi:chromate transporter